MSSKAEQILAGLGGADNVVEIEPCITRLRTEVKDGSLVDQAALKAAGAHGVMASGTIVQVGVTGDITIPLNLLVGKEIVWRGSQRFDTEFGEAVALISSRAIDVRPILSHHFPLEQAVEAFEQAGDRSVACKVQITFGEQS